MKKKEFYITVIFILLIMFNAYVSNQGLIFNEKFIIRSILIFIIYILSMFFYIKGWKNGWNLIFKHRYKIAIILFVLCILLELNGSSIAMWAQYVQGPDSISTGTILGVPRAIRSDEWALNTPMALSQYHNFSGSFPYFSDTVRGTSTDVFLVYGQPVYDIAVIFRPFHWGYLFLSQAKGLSFFWYGRLIALFLVTFEFGRLITKNNKKLAFVFSMLISFAPIVQWWFAINGLIEMLIFGELAVLMIYKYINNEDYIKRSIYMAVIVICSGAYVLTFYPSWQVPLFYVFFSLLIWIIWEKNRKIKFSYKDVIIICVGLLLFSLIILHIVIKSHDTISYILNTAYPGSRVETGGGEIKMFFNYAFNMFLPYRSSGIPGNVCEQAVFIDFFPMGIILGCIVLFFEKKKDKLLICLLTVNAVLSLWCIVPWPSILAKITLLSNSQPSRTFLTVGFVNVLVLIRSMSLREKKINENKSILFASILAVIIALISNFLYREYITKKMFIVIIIFLVTIFISILMYQNKKDNNMFIIICITLMIICGATVNPVQKGINVVYDNPLIQNIKLINDNKVGKWIVDGLQYPVINYPIMAGAPTINSTNVYPTLERWNKLNNFQNEDIYNRYAHININLQNVGTSEFVPGVVPDTFTVNLNISDLESLDVKYILTVNNIENISNNKIKFKKLYDDYGYKIYEVGKDS